ncbi:MAG TPA: cupin domain-containing protein [Rectinemataceae bacterium]
MRLIANLSDVAPEKYEGYEYYPLLSGQNGCRAGCRTGVLAYVQEEYKQGGVHEDQEGFFVMEGRGRALVGEEELPLSPGACFIVPPGTYHSIKKDPECEYVKVFFFHAAV